MGFLLRKSRQVILTLSDLHFPFNHPKTFSFLEYLKAHYKPTKIIGIGDELDLYKLSRYDPDPDSLGCLQEITMGLEKMEKLYSIFPKVDACTSNHSARGARRAFAAGIPKLFLKSIHSWMKAPKGWQWKDEYIIKTKSGPVRFWHGEPYSPGTWHRAGPDQRINSVLGHVHVNAGTYFNRVRDSEIWTMNVGCLVDESSYAMAYSKQYKTRPSYGTGLIIDGVPLFIPLE